MDFVFGILFLRSTWTCFWSSLTFPEFHLVFSYTASRRSTLGPWFLFNCALWDSVPNGSLQWSSSSLVWIRGCDMVPWSHLRYPFLGRMWTDLTSELTHFNLVIHLGNLMRNSWLCHSPPFYEFSPLLLSSWTLGKSFSAAVTSCWTTRNLLLSVIITLLMQHAVHRMS